MAVHDLSDPANPERVRYFRRSAETSFWTAQLAAPGKSVVATSYGDPSLAEPEGQLYTFPDVPRSTPTRTATVSPTVAETPTATEQLTTAPTPTDAVETGGATDGDGPGFSPVAALTGLGIGAWRLLSEVDAADESED